MNLASKFPWPENKHSEIDYILFEFTDSVYKYVYKQVFSAI